MARIEKKQIRRRAIDKLRMVSPFKVSRIDPITGLDRYVTYAITMCEYLGITIEDDTIHTNIKTRLIIHDKNKGIYVSISKKDGIIIEYSGTFCALNENRYLLIKESIEGIETALGISFHPTSIHIATDVTGIKVEDLFPVEDAKHIWKFANTKEERNLIDYGRRPDGVPLIQVKRKSFRFVIYDKKRENRVNLEKTEAVKKIYDESYKDFDTVIRIEYRMNGDLASRQGFVFWNSSKTELEFCNNVLGYLARRPIIELYAGEWKINRNFDLLFKQTPREKYLIPLRHIKHDPKTTDPDRQLAKAANLCSTNNVIDAVERFRAKLLFAKTGPTEIQRFEDTLALKRELKKKASGE